MGRDTGWRRVLLALGLVCLSVPAWAQQTGIIKGKVVATDVLRLTATGTSAGTSPLKTVFTSGPFTLQTACWDAGAGTTAMRFLLTSSEPGSVVNSATLPTPQQFEQVLLSHNPQSFNQIEQRCDLRCRLVAAHSSSSCRRGRADVCQVRLGKHGPDRAGNACDRE